MAKLLIVDQHAVVRRGLHQILSEAFPGGQFGEAGTADEASALLARERWNVMIIDPNLAGRDGHSLLDEAKRAGVAPLVFSTHPEEEFAIRYLRLGASDLIAINSHLVPLIAHDRSSFGGAVATTGMLLGSCALFGQPTRRLWWAMAMAGGAGFGSAIGIHPIIGYVEFSHLAPAYVGALLFCAGIYLCRAPNLAVESRILTEANPPHSEFSKDLKVPRRADLQTLSP